MPCFEGLDASGGFLSDLVFFLWTNDESSFLDLVGFFWVEMEGEISSRVFGDENSTLYT